MQHFYKLPKTLLLQNRKQALFHEVSRQIADQVDNLGAGTAIDNVARVPTEAQVIYWLWRFQCEAGTGGFEVFVLNQLGIYAPEIHKALCAVEANELLRRLEAAIAIAREGSADFKRLSDQSWFNRYGRVPEFPSFHSIDLGVYAIIDALTDKVVAFMRQHAQSLFED